MAAERHPDGAESPSLVLSLAGVLLVAFNLRIAITSIPPLLAWLGLSGAAQSVLVTLPVLCFAVGALAGPRLRRLLGEERAIFWLVALLTVCMALRGVFPTWAMFPATIGAALSIALLNVLMPSLVKRRFPARVHYVSALFTSVFFLGCALSSGLAVPLLRALGDSIRWGLAIWALPAAAALVGWLPQLRVPKLELPPAREEGGVWIWRHPLAWHVTVFLGSTSLMFYGTFSWIPEINAARGIGESTTSVLFVIMHLCGLLGSLAFPMAARRSLHQRFFCAVAVLVQLGGVIGLFLGPAWSVHVFSALFGVGNGSTLSLALLLLVLRSDDEHVAARLSSMAQSAGYIIAGCGPLVVGLLHTLMGGWQLSLVFLILAGATSLVTGLLAGRNLLISRPVMAQEPEAPAQAMSTC